ncbi:MAG: hypothetical protein JXB39_02530 [Deltaproteobacteria bacterium]|nr:hypothetical protein [Deltaproteobacteria bacterium]
MPPLPALLVCVACGGDVVWSEIEVVDETGGEGAWLVEVAEDEIAWMAEVTGVDGVPVKVLAVVAEIPGPEEEDREHLDPEASDYQVGGRYIVYRRRIEVALEAESYTPRHELCHALDRATGISVEHEATLHADLLPDRLLSRAIWQEGHEAAEVFAILCTEEALAPLEALVDDACDLHLQDEGIALVHRWAFPELRPQLAEPLDLAPRWVDLPLGEADLGPYDLEMHDGTLWASVAIWDEGALDLREGLLAVDPATGDALAFLELPEPPGVKLAQVLVGDGLLAAWWPGREQALAWDGGAWRSVRLPVPPWAGAVFHDGRIFLDRHSRPAAVLVVEPGASTWAEEPLPAGSNAKDFALCPQGRRLFILSGSRAWERKGDVWVEGTPPERHDARTWALLDDDRVVIPWFAGYLSGLAAVHPDGAVSLPEDPCAEAVDLDSARLLTDGEAVVVAVGARVGLLSP